MQWKIEARWQILRHKAGQVCTIKRQNIFLSLPTANPRTTITNFTDSIDHHDFMIKGSTTYKSNLANKGTPPQQHPLSWIPCLVEIETTTKLVCWEVGSIVLQLNKHSRDFSNHSRDARHTHLRMEKWQSLRLMSTITSTVKICQVMIFLSTSKPRKVSHLSFILGGH